MNTSIKTIVLCSVAALAWPTNTGNFFGRRAAPPPPPNNQRQQQRQGFGARMTGGARRAWNRLFGRNAGQPQNANPVGAGAVAAIHHGAMHPEAALQAQHHAAAAGTGLTGFGVAPLPPAAPNPLAASGSGHSGAASGVVGTLHPLAVPSTAPVAATASGSSMPATAVLARDSSSSSNSSAASELAGFGDGSSSIAAPERPRAPMNTGSTPPPDMRAAHQLGLHDGPEALPPDTSGTGGSDDAPGVSATAVAAPPFAPFAPRGQFGGAFRPPPPPPGMAVAGRGFGGPRPVAAMPPAGMPAAMPAPRPGAVHLLPPVPRPAPRGPVGAAPASDSDNSSSDGNDAPGGSK